VRIRNTGGAAVPLSVTAPAGVQVSPALLTLAARRSATVTVTAMPGAKAGAGRIVAGSIAIPFQLVDAPPPAPPLGDLQVIRRRGRPYGVRFTAGALARGDKGVSVVPVGNLVLTLEGPGRRELTPPGGARDLLPGEYAYTLTDEVLRALPAGRYRFVVRARGTAGGPPVVRRSRPFRIG
jgi:hypothetical protein